MTSLLIFPHIRFLFFFLGLFGLILRADSTDDRFSLILQMMERNILRLLHISFTDGFYQFFMLTDQKISCLLLLQILYTITIHLLTEIVQDLIQTLIIRSLIYDLVESHIGFRQTDQISLCFCFFEFFGCHPEP